MSHAHDDRSRALLDARAQLAVITDAHVRALLDPDGCEPSDWDEANAAGLVCGSDDGGGARTDIGDRALTEAQRIADGLGEHEARTLVPGNEWHDGAFFGDDAGARCVAKGLIREWWQDDPGHRDGGLTGRAVTPLGRLVLAFRERSSK